MMKFSPKLTILLLCFAIVPTISAAWVKQNTNTLAWLRDIHFVTEKHGLIVGGNGTLLETKDGGATWSKRERITDDNIIQIGFLNQKDGWILCERSVYSRGDASMSYMMRTADGGETWERSDMKAGRTRITKIVLNGDGNGFAIGEGGAVFVSRDGRSWERSGSTLRFLLLDGELTNATTGTVVGAGGSIFFTEDAGTSWNEANVYGDKTAKLNSVFFADKRNGWAVGRQGKIFQTFSGGKTWREQKSGVSKDLMDVYFKNTADGWAVGDEGVILYTTTAGNVWQVEESPVKHKLQKVVFNDGKGFAVGFGGTLLVSGNQPTTNQSTVKPVLMRRN